MRHGIRLLLFACLISSVLLFSACRNTANQTVSADTSVEPTKSRRGFPVWTPEVALPNCEVRGYRPIVSWEVPYDSPESLTIFFSTTAQCGQRKDAFSQIQLVVLDPLESMKKHPKFWKGVERGQVENLSKQSEGYLLIPSEKSALVKLGNVWIRLVSVNHDFLKDLATGYVEAYAKVRPQLSPVYQKLGIDERSQASQDARAMFEVMYDYREYQPSEVPDE